MIYVSIDIETTSLKPDPSNILQVAMVLEDTEKATVPIAELPWFSCYIKHPIYTGEAKAIAMNARIFNCLAGDEVSPYPIYTEDKWVAHAVIWLQQQGKPRFNAAGKNIGNFEWNFLPDAFKDAFNYRLIDAGSVMIKWREKGVRSLAELTGVPVSHDALDDARDVILALRQTYERNQ